ncbi:TrkH family potassium uptake protein [Flavobacteriaceae bacterium Ap0902]|nr:TrkH family potassium uptake protein [Flavobacteriaceae bacterium Ap0902]
MPYFKKINFRIIINLLGILLLLNSLFMLLCVPISLYFEEDAYKGILYAGLVTAVAGLTAYLSTRKANKNVGKREGYLIVGLGWISMAFFGSLPYLFVMPQLSAEVQQINNINLTNAVFETVSGYSTTGASILQDIEIMPKGLLFWRSLTHWIGGMGIIVLTIAILPLLGIGGMQLFVAEAPGISADKLHPRITDTAKRLWLIYMAFTVIEFILLKIFGMGWYDAANHAFSTLSTGGFSTKNASIAHWNDNPAVQYIIILFMFLAGTNFVLNYYIFKRKFKKVFSNQEFLFYVGIIIVLTMISTTIVHLYADPGNTTITHPGVGFNYLGERYFELEEAFRHSLFSIISVITTTGFVSADFSQWTPFLTIIFFAMMFMGGSAGSTSGGVKIVRHVILMKNSYSEFKRLIHSRAVIPVRYNNKAIEPKIVFNVLAFFMIYMLIFIFGSIILSFLDSGLDPDINEFASTLSVTASSLGNVGPALGKYSPVNNYAGMTDSAKWFSAFLMLLGRLELFTILILFTPAFWKK